MQPERRRVVVVTGANEGIGYHLTSALLADGYRVAGLDLAGEQLQALGRSYPERVRFLECDLTVDGDVQSAVEGVRDEWGQIDVLVNNAATFEFGLVGERGLAATRREFEVNYFGPLRTIEAVLPAMRERGEGIVHNVSSGVAAVGHPGLSGYASTKGAIEGFVRSLQLELQTEDVAVTLMYPPLTETRSAARLYPAAMLHDPADVGRKLAGQIESTGPVVYADRSTRFGMALARRVPWLVERGTRRFLEPGAVPDEAGTGTPEQPGADATEQREE